MKKNERNEVINLHVLSSGGPFLRLSLKHGESVLWPINIDLHYAAMLR